jgi:hypothetical protein
MANRGTRRLLPALSVCAVVLIAGCGEGGDAAAAAPSAPPEFAATFDVDAPLQVVAGNNQAWVLAETDGGAAVSRVDHTGRVSEAVDLTGQSHEMAPYGDGVVVARVACGGDDCEDTVAEVRVLDPAGESLAEDEIARGEGPPYCESGTCDTVDILGVNGDEVWLETYDILPASTERFVSWNPETGRTSSDRPQDRGEDWRPAPSRRLDVDRYQRPPSLEVAPEPVAAGQDDQVFVLESDGVIRRYVGLVAQESIDVPADLFFQPFDSTRPLYFDKSPSVVVGCIQQEWPDARCWIGSP